MAAIDDSFREFLRESGISSEEEALGAPLGGKGAKPNPEAQQRLISRLEGQQRFNNGVLITVIIANGVLLALAIWACVVYREKPEVLMKFLGGSLVDLIAVTSGLATIWQRKVVLDMLTTILPNLRPEDTLKVIESLLVSGRTSLTATRSTASKRNEPVEP